MMPLPDEVRLQHMLDAAQKAVEFLGDRSREELHDDEVLGLALVRLLEIIGEAAKGVDSSTRSAHPEIPWKQMAGARDRLIHGYFDVDVDVVWSIVKDDLPSVIAAIEKILGQDQS